MSSTNQLFNYLPVVRGVSMVQLINNNQLRKDCASILESMKVIKSSLNGCTNRQIYLCTYLNMQYMYMLTYQVICSYIHVHVLLMQLYAEAAVMYDKAQCWDKAAGVYIKSKNWHVYTIHD